jgi:hypothetical protein
VLGDTTTIDVQALLEAFLNMFLKSASFLNEVTKCCLVKRKLLVFGIALQVPD